MAHHVAELPWMPPVNTVGVVPAAKWWDVVVVPQHAGLDALEVLDRTSGHTPGPVLWEPLGSPPCLYFLVPIGTADPWAVPDTQALGAACFIPVPGPTTLEPPSIHWLVPPDPNSPDALVDADALREALLHPASAT